MDNIIYQNHRYQQRVKQRQNTKNIKSNLSFSFDSQKGQKLINGILVTGIIFLGIYLVLFFTYHLALKPFLYVENIEIHFQEKLDIDQNDILSVTKLNNELRYADIQEEEISSMITGAFPYIKNVEVNKIFPATVSIAIWGRKPVCVSLFNTSEFSVPFAIDEEGRVFELGTAVKEFDLPVLSGLRLDKVELNTQLPALYIPLLEDLMHLKEEEPIIYNRISEIAVDEKGRKGYDLFVYFRMYDLPVQMGSRLDSEEIGHAVQVLDLLQSARLSDSYRLLDFRSSKPTLKRK